MDNQRKQECLKVLKRHHIKITKTSDNAKRYLIENGFYYEDGSLHENYGGISIDTSASN